MRKQSMGKSIHEFREITPFYMQHSYSHFRYDPTYDPPNEDSPSSTADKNLGKTERKISSNDRKISLIERKMSKQERKVSKQERKLSKQDRKVSTTVEGFSSTNWDPRRRVSSVNDHSTFNKFSSNLLSDNHSTSLDENILRWNMKGTTISEIPSLTRKVVTENIDKTQGMTLRKLPVKSNSLDALDEGASKELCKTPSLKTHSYHNPSKVLMLKELVQDRLGKGITVAELAKEAFFEDVLDICEDDDFFPAYELGVGISFENYRALRKCKYLRVSEKNLESLKEATLNFLKDEEG